VFVTCFPTVQRSLVAGQRQVSSRRRSKNPFACESSVHVFQQPAELGWKPVVRQFPGNGQHASGHVDVRLDAFVVDGQPEQLVWSPDVVDIRPLSTVRELAGRIVQLMLKNVDPKRRQQKRAACHSHTHRRRFSTVPQTRKIHSGDMAEVLQVALMSNV